MDNAKAGIKNSFAKVGAGLKSFGQATKDRAQSIRTDGLKERIEALKKSLKTKTEAAEAGRERRSSQEEQAMKADYGQIRETEEEKDADNVYKGGNEDEEDQFGMPRRMERSSTMV